MKLPTIFLDPNAQVFTLKEAEHFVIFLVGAYLFGILFPPLAILVAAVVVGAAFELGQFDIARQVPVFQKAPPAKGFLPGYGFSPLDVGADFAGAVVAVLLRMIFVG